MRICMISVMAAMCAFMLSGATATASPLDRQAFKVSDFGAVANSNVDSGPAIRKAIAAAIAFGRPSDVVFDNGTYRVSSTKENAWWPKAAIVVIGAKDLVLRGTGKTVIVVTDPLSAGIVLRDNETVGAQGLTIDYDPVPQVVSKVVGIDPDHNFIEVEQLQPDPDMMTFADPLFQDANVHMLYTTFEFRKDGSPMWGVEPVGLTLAGPTVANRFKLAIPVHVGHTRRDAISVAGLRVGDLLISSSPTGGGAAFSMIRNKSAQARAITLHASPGLAFFPFANDTVSLIGCVIEIKPGSHRILASDADGIHGRSNRHIDIENCSFSGTGDDGINLHASAAVPLSRLSPTTLSFKRTTYTVRQGDTLEQVRPETGVVIGKYLVKSVDNTGKDGMHVEFDVPVPDVNMGTDNMTGDQFFNLTESNEDCIVRNNVFATHRGRDLLLQVHRGLIEHNRFDNQRTLLDPPIVSSDPGFDNAMMWLASTSIEICYDPSWGEGPITEGVTIRDNTFTGSQYRSPAIWIQDHLRANGGYSGVGSHKDVTIEGNTFKNRNASAVVAQFVTNLVIKDNKVIGRGARMGAASADPAFDLKQCPGAVVSGNAVEKGLFTKEISE